MPGAVLSLRLRRPAGQQASSRPRLLAFDLPPAGSRRPPSHPRLVLSAETADEGAMYLRHQLLIGYICIFHLMGAAAAAAAAAVVVAAAGERGGAGGVRGPIATVAAGVVGWGCVRGHGHMLAIIAPRPWAAPRRRGGVHNSTGSMRLPTLATVQVQYQHHVGGQPYPHPYQKD